MEGKINLNEKNDKNRIYWVSKDYKDTFRGKYWKIGMIFLVLSIAIAGLILSSWTFSLAIVVFAIVYYMVHQNAAQDLPVEISEVGIKIGNTIYSYAQLSAFSMDISENSNRIIFYIKNDLLGERSLDLFETDPAIVKKFLTNKIPEIEKKSDTLVEILSKFLKI